MISMGHGRRHNFRCHVDIVIQEIGRTANKLSQDNQHEFLIKEIRKKRKIFFFFFYKLRYSSVFLDSIYRRVDKSLARPGRKQVYVAVRMA
jgi:hypothetical protein